MDAKESQLIDYYHRRIISNTFDEKDVYVLLILLRRHSKVKSAVYEFSNFVAHREKDRGYIQEYILDKKRILEGKIKNGAMIVEPVFTIEQIERSFNEVLTKLNKQVISNNAIKEITLCIIVLLQDVQLVDKKNKSIGKLAFGIDKESITLLGQANVRHRGEILPCIFPVLEVKNTYTNAFDSFIDMPAQIAYVVSIKRVDGDLIIEYDANHKIED